MDREALERELESAFGGTEETRRIVARQARDLADAGLVAEALGYEVTVETVVDNLEDAPEDYTLVERWNWWLGSLELADGGYGRFRVRPDAVDDGTE